jgi:drug/metabolite transporter (DMT)-like permease
MRDKDADQGQGAGPAAGGMPVAADGAGLSVPAVLAPDASAPDDSGSAVTEPPSAGWVAPALVLAATAALAFKGIVAKLAYGAGVDVAGILLLRFGLAVPLFWLVWLLVLRPGSGTGGADTARRSGANTAGTGVAGWGRDLGRCVPTGILFAIATEADFRALQYLDAGTSRLILFTYPAIVLLLTAALERRAPGLRLLGLMALTYAGLALVVRPGEAGAAGPDFWAGTAWAMTSAVTYALFLVAARPTMARMGSGRFTVLSNTVTFLFVAPIGLLAGVPAVPTAEGVMWGAVIAGVCTVLPFFLLNEGVRRWGAARASRLSFLGPVITLAAAWTILGEEMDARALLGAAIVLAGVVALELGGRKG